MNKERYLFSVSKGYKDYVFDSIGPKGKIRKVVRYSPYIVKGQEYYNLGFGDLNEETGEIDDLNVSDNKDRDKVLATVASTVLEFMKRFPCAFIFARGSTPARTRLYQIAITANLEDISKFMIIKGYKGGQWHNFKSEINYEGFLALNIK